MSTVFMDDSFRVQLRWTRNRVAAYYDSADPDVLRRGVHISLAIVQPSFSSQAKAVSPRRRSRDGGPQRVSIRLELRLVSLMNDPLSEVITLLQPRAVFSRPISGAGRWGVRYSAFGQPSFCAVLEGSCRLTVDGHRPLTLEAGDFVLLPATPGFAMTGFEPVRLERFDPHVTSKVLGEVRHGTRSGKPDVRLLGGWFAFDSPDTALLLSLLPSLVHVRGVERLSTLVRLVGEETSERRAGRDLVLTRLVEVLLIEALRATPGEDAPPGLLRGLADARIAPAIRQMHGQIARAWTVAQLRSEEHTSELQSLRHLVCRLLL